MAAELVPHGLNEENIYIFTEQFASVNDDADADMTLPAAFHGKGLALASWTAFAETGGPGADPGQSARSGRVGERPLELGQDRLRNPGRQGRGLAQRGHEG